MELENATDIETCIFIGKKLLEECSFKVMECKHRLNYSKIFIRMYSEKSDHKNAVKYLEKTLREERSFGASRETNLDRMLP